MERVEHKEMSDQGSFKRIPPKELDDIDFDDLIFKPLTRGLGFHPEKKEGHVIRPSRQVSPVHKRTPNIQQQGNLTPATELPRVNIPEGAPLYARAIAFGMDLLLLFAGIAVTFLVLAKGSGVEIQNLMSILSPLELILFTSGVFCIYFILYFSFLDLSSTVGKELMGIKVDGKNITLKNTFSRSLLALLSLPLLGIPMLTGLVEVISETKIVKR
jgi:hypothetical protein